MKIILIHFLKSQIVWILIVVLLAKLLIHFNLLYQLSDYLLDIFLLIIKSSNSASTRIEKKKVFLKKICLYSPLIIWNYSSIEDIINEGPTISDKTNSITSVDQWHRKQNDISKRLGDAKEKRGY